MGLWISVDQLITSQLATPCWRDPKRSKQLSTAAILGFQFGLYHVVAPLSFLCSISLASLFAIIPMHEVTRNPRVPERFLSLLLRVAAWSNPSTGRMWNWNSWTRKWQSNSSPISTSAGCFSLRSQIPRGGQYLCSQLGSSLSLYISYRYFRGECRSIRNVNFDVNNIK